MHILLDENMDPRRAKFLPGHTVDTVKSIGWLGIKNGELLKRISSIGYDAFLTYDQHIPQQNSLKNLQAAVIILSPRTNRWEHLQELLPHITQILQKPLQAGIYDVHWRAYQTPDRKIRSGK